MSSLLVSVLFSILSNGTFIGLNGPIDSDRVKEVYRVHIALIDPLLGVCKWMVFHPNSSSDSAGCRSSRWKSQISIKQEFYPLFQ